MNTEHFINSVNSLKCNSQDNTQTNWLNNTKVLFAAAGTAGHIVPAICVAENLIKHGIKPVFVGSDGMENELLKPYNFDFIRIEKLPLERSFSRFYLNLLLPFKLFASVKCLCREIKRKRIKAVVVFGGYISTPAILAAKFCKIPLLVHEQNVKIGLANHIGLRFCDYFAYSFPQTKFNSKVKREINEKRTKIELIGLPLREILCKSILVNTQSYCQTQQNETINQTDDNLPNILIFGGSLGAKTINESVFNLLYDHSDVLDICSITHIVGKRDDLYENSESDAKFFENLKNYKQIKYAQNLPELMKNATIVVARSGAGTVHELAALSKPSILIPLPIGNGEQSKNAQFLGKGTIIIDDFDFNSEVLFDKITHLINNQKELQIMSAYAKNVAIFGATEKLSNKIIHFIAKRKLLTFKKPHFMAISGAGIAPISKCFSSFSNVTGCDSDKNGHSEKHLIDRDLLVYSSAIKSHNPELVSAKKLEQENKLEVFHRSDALDLLLKSHNHSIAVAGAHGKTTITSMIAQILEIVSPQNSSFVIGAKAVINNQITNGGKLCKNLEIITAEADESDGSFQKYTPEIAVISSFEVDHLDYYENEENVKKAFLNFAKNSKNVVTTNAVSNQLNLKSELSNTFTNLYIIENDSMQFFELAVPGDYNQMNAMLASKALELLGVSMQQSQNSLKNFQGASRRFERHQIGDFLIIDDYAHHPTEIANLISGAIEEFGTNDLVLLFQPHLYSRTRDFASDFAAELSKVQCPIVTKIFKAREEQEDFLDVTPKTIAQFSKKIITTDNIEDGVKMAINLAKSRSKVILSVGAGPCLIEDFKHQLYRETPQKSQTQL